MEKIIEFQGENRWLSNFWKVPIRYGGRLYPCVENAYQAAKCENDYDRDQFTGITPGQAKRLGRTVTIRSDWESRKLQVMETLLRLKFQHPTMGFRLVQTGNAQIEEGNHWGDTFWGIDLRTGQGENNLGKLIMKIRQDLKEGKCL